MGMGRAKGSGGGMVRALAMDCHQMLGEDKKYNRENKYHTLKLLKSQEGLEK